MKADPTITDERIAEIKSGRTPAQLLETLSDAFGMYYHESCWDDAQMRIDEDEIVKQLEDMPRIIARLEAMTRERDGLTRAANGFKWLGNNLHNIKSSPDAFRELYEAALKDLEAAIAAGAGGAKASEPPPQSP